MEMVVAMPMDMSQLDATDCYRGLFHAIRHDKGRLAPTQSGKPAGGRSQELAEAMPAPGGETVEDQALVFTEALNGLLENWYTVKAVKADNEVQVHQYAHRGIECLGGFNSARALGLAANSGLRRLGSAT